MCKAFSESQIIQDCVFQLRKMVHSKKYVKGSIFINMVLYFNTNSITPLQRYRT